ncbi:MAG: hypothetical protein AAB409_02360 [Gemmatimonadota bacterium]
MRRAAVSVAALVCALGAAGARGADGTSADTAPAEQPPLTRVTVLPVFAVPAGGREPTAGERSLLLAHLRLAQARYAVLLGHRDSFLLEPVPLVHHSPRTLAFLRAAPESGVPVLVAELLAVQGVSRYSARHVYVIVVINDSDDFPVGGGRPLNGGLGTGAGLVVLSSFALARSPNVQSTLQHELGHGFGLVHSDNYGEEMATGRSLMSYNPAHHTSGLAPSATPGVLLPVELAALALNRRVFPALAGEATVALPAAVPGRADIAWLPPMAIPDQPSVALAVTTRSGEEYESAAFRLAHGRVRSSAGPGVTFDAGTMWQSSRSADGWVALDLAFPAPVTLTGVGIHTGHSGLYHQAQEVRLEVLDGASYRVVAAGPIGEADCLLEMAAATGRTWRLSYRAGPSGMVTVRGLEFRGAAGEDIFPPMVREVAPARRPCGE